jgi:S-adenosylmethionine:tRNA ribosyltransferase-isomerase
LHEIGKVPLPPYILRARREGGAPEERAEDAEWYQTVYARPPGGAASVAAPTAGLHFTEELLGKLEGIGVKRAVVELEVGMGTFLPVEAETLEGHVMHKERYRVPEKTVRAIEQARACGGRVVAVGTTAVRALEAAWAEKIIGRRLEQEAGADILGETDLKIGPEYEFKVVEGMVTNFHLPRSTLMALVAGFLGGNGVERLKGLYGEAVREGYRFYSYGDAMLIV